MPQLRRVLRLKSVILQRFKTGVSVVECAEIPKMRTRMHVAAAAPAAAAAQLKFSSRLSCQLSVSAILIGGFVIGRSIRASRSVITAAAQPNPLWSMSRARRQRVCGAHLLSEKIFRTRSSLNASSIIVPKNCQRTSKRARSRHLALTCVYKHMYICMHL